MAPVLAYADPAAVRLAEAAGRGDAATVRQLVAGGADPNPRARDDESAMEGPARSQRATL